MCAALCKACRPFGRPFGTVFKSSPLSPIFPLRRKTGEPRKNMKCLVPTDLLRYGALLNVIRELGRRHPSAVVSLGVALEFRRTKFSLRETGRREGQRLRRFIQEVWRSWRNAFVGRRRRRTRTERWVAALTICTEEQKLIKYHCFALCRIISPFPQSRATDGRRFDLKPSET